MPLERPARSPLTPIEIKVDSPSTTWFLSENSRVELKGLIADVGKLPPGAAGALQDALGGQVSVMAVTGADGTKLMDTVGLSGYEVDASCALQAPTAEVSKAYPLEYRTKCYQQPEKLVYIRPPRGSGRAIDRVLLTSFIKSWLSQPDAGGTVRQISTSQESDEPRLTASDLLSMPPHVRKLLSECWSEYDHAKKRKANALAEHVLETVRQVVRVSSTGSQTARRCLTPPAPAPP